MRTPATTPIAMSPALAATPPGSAFSSRSNVSACLLAAAAGPSGRGLPPRWQGTVHLQPTPTHAWPTFLGMH